MHINAGVLRVAYLEKGDSSGTPVILLHGFPYDIHAYDEVAPMLRSCRVIIPFLRGYGETRFLREETPRSGQQAALAHDLLSLMDALGIRRAVLGGYDWGGRAACIVAALWPERVKGLISCGGYNIQHISEAGRPLPPEDEYRYWYQYYFHGERGRSGLTRNRNDFCRLLWRLWSPNWQFRESLFQQTAASFANPDFVDVVIHSYRHRYGLVPGDPAYEATEQRLEAQPPISVPVVVLDGEGDGVMPAQGSQGDRPHFSGPYQRRVIPLAGHNLPQESPGEFARAVQALV